MARRSVDPASLDRRAAHQLLTSCVLPRPIAFVSTVDAEGRANLAPFSFYGGVASQPPIISLAIGRRGGEDKDTLRNIRANGELVVNLASEQLAEAVNQASADYAYGVSEIERCGLTPVASELVGPPRIAESPVAFEARLVELIERPGGADVTLVLARVLRYQLDTALLRADGTPDPALLRPLARLGGRSYGCVREVFELGRPRP